MTVDGLPTLQGMTYGELLAALRKDLQLDATTDVLPGTILQALIDRNGFANFVQLPAAQKRIVNFGTGTITWPGASASSNVLLVPHGLGAIPAGYIAFPTSIANTSHVAVDGRNDVAIDATNFRVDATTVAANQPANTATTPIAWIAWL